MTKWRKGIIACAFLTLLTASTCNNNSGKITPNPPVITDSDACPSACANLEKLGCPEAAPIDMGTKCILDTDCKNVNGDIDTTQECGSGKCVTSCVNFCITTQKEGVWLDPVCVSKMTSCRQIDSCPSPEQRKPTCEGPMCPPNERTK